MLRRMLASASPLLASASRSVSARVADGARPPGVYAIALLMSNGGMRLPLRWPAPSLLERRGVWLPLLPARRPLAPRRPQLLSARRFAPSRSMQPPPDPPPPPPPGCCLASSAARCARLQPPPRLRPSSMKHRWVHSCLHGGQLLPAAAAAAAIGGRCAGPGTFWAAAPPWLWFNDAECSRRRPACLPCLSALSMPRRHAPLAKPGLQAAAARRALLGWVQWQQAPVPAAPAAQVDRLMDLIVNSLYSNRVRGRSLAHALVA